jgi:hypothetical protein
MIPAKNEAKATMPDPKRRDGITECPHEGSMSVSPWEKIAREVVG